MCNDTVTVKSQLVYSVSKLNKNSESGLQISCMKLHHSPIILIFVTSQAYIQNNVNICCVRLGAKVRES